MIVYSVLFQDKPENHVKRMKFCPAIPSWERELDFDPSSVVRVTEESWVDSHGETTQLPTHVISAEDVSEGKDFSFVKLTFRDPHKFMAGCLHTRIKEWEKLDTPDDVLTWLKQGVDIVPMFKHFKGNFKGKSYDSDIPPPAYFPNGSICKDYTEMRFMLTSDCVLSHYKYGLH